MVSVSLKDVLATGAFGPVCLGCAREALEAAFGEPEGTDGTSCKYRRPNIWKYGDVEFYFDRTRRNGFPLDRRCGADFRWRDFRWTGTADRKLPVDSEAWKGRRGPRAVI
jgi:hypothetical protein